MPVKPLFGLVLLTTRAVPIAARAGNRMLMSAVTALIQMRAEAAGTTVHNGLDNLFVVFRHGLAIAFEILRGV